MKAYLSLLADRRFLAFCSTVCGLMAGLLVPLAGLPAIILTTAMLAIAPAVAGTLVAPLRRARASTL